MAKSLKRNEKKGTAQTAVMEETGKSFGVRQVRGGVVFRAFCPEAANVQIAGDFNSWQPEKTKMKRVSTNGVWEVKLPLTAGTYRYRLVVDGQWQKDPYNDDCEPNPYGEFNSIVKVSF
ncbi:MAG: glycoside hydrolase [Candidatus Brocadiia bacterium]|nr:MAG: glycoside hydrolase [Candidatus Brocadiia bacterium]